MSGWAGHPDTGGRYEPQTGPQAPSGVSRREHCGHVLTPCGCPNSPDIEQAYEAVVAMLATVTRERDAYRTAAETFGLVARDNRLAQAPAAPACGDAWCACQP